ncbi:hypothetical protein ACF1G5_13195 [Streptomyces coeruleorubidus]|uniref:hypothetical protein n=1 Tax=Streptomyces coeruleorubidus TaxID=116188 RepID=UPI0036FB7E77
MTDDVPAVAAVHPDPADHEWAATASIRLLPARECRQQSPIWVLAPSVSSVAQISVVLGKVTVKAPSVPAATVFWALARTLPSPSVMCTLTVRSWSQVTPTRTAVIRELLTELRLASQGKSCWAAACAGAAATIGAEASNTVAAERSMR